MNYYIKITRIFLILLTVVAVSGQSAGEIRNLKKKYEQQKAQDALGDFTDDGSELEQNIEDRPAKLLIKPSDITKYYYEKITITYYYSFLIVIQ